MEEGRALVAPLLALVASLALASIAVGALLKSRNMEFWIGAHLRERLRRLAGRVPPRHVYFCFADHFEPFGGTADRERALRRVHQWSARYPALAARHRDSSGRQPQHTFFYPAEEYDPEVLDELAALRGRGLGDVELHLHHDDDTAEHLHDTLTGFARTLHERHGLLRRDAESGRLQYVFIHGNWALDNSRSDGRWCGVDNELDVLLRTGCAADMTMPSAPSDTQTGKINSIYWARGRDGCRKSHDRGRDVAVGESARTGELLMIQGPLTLNWKEARFGVLPRIESGELSADAPPGAHRVALWARCGVCVTGAEEHVFIKVHSHGATEGSMQMLFDGGGFELLWSELERQYRDRAGCKLHYVTAWEMVETVRMLAGGRCRPGS